MEVVKDKQELSECTRNVTTFDLIQKRSEGDVTNLNLSLVQRQSWCAILSQRRNDKTLIRIVVVVLVMLSPLWKTLKHLSMRRKQKGFGLDLKN